MVQRWICLFQQLVINFQSTFKQFGCIKTTDSDAGCNENWGCTGGNLADIAPQTLLQCIGIFGRNIWKDHN